jgi:Holliday junction resolvase-like predicted endonuclease|tara:strand:+ start:194 stop:652 length:459 start_codon:yes stop_codon:yes gene_type:complete
MSRTGYVYEIKCKDSSIKDRYIGSSWDTDFREKQHKSMCNNINAHNYNTTIYKYIRENGGWDNFELVVIYTEECENLKERRILEQNFIDEYGGIEFLLNEMDAVLSKVKEKERKDRWTKDNAERVKKTKSNWYQKNKELTKERSRQHYYKNK